MEKRNLFVDIETSGIKPEKGAVPLCVGMLLDTGPEDPSPKHLIVTIKPTLEQWEQASPEALKVNGFTWEKLEAEGMDLNDAVAMVCGWLAENDISRTTVRYIGQNPKFDLKFLRAFMPELEWMDFPLQDEEATDVIDLAKELGSKDQTIRFIDFKGHNIALALGVEPEGALHTALGGIQAVRRNYHAVVAKLTAVSAAKKVRV